MQVCNELAATIIENGVVRQATPEELAKAKVGGASHMQRHSGAAAAQGACCREAVQRHARARHAAPIQAAPQLQHSRSGRAGGARVSGQCPPGQHCVCSCE